MAGMRFKLTDSTVKYFIVVKSAYSAPDTTLTLYGGTDYTLSGGAMTSPYFSIVKAPAGFPMGPAKWTVTKTDSSDRAQATPTNLTWYNIGTTNCQLSLPIGAWYLSCNVFLSGALATGSAYNQVNVALSTANNSVSHALLSVFQYVQTAIAGGQLNGIISNVTFTVTAKTTM